MYIYVYIYIQKYPKIYKYTYTKAPLYSKKKKTIKILKAYRNLKKTSCI